MQATAAVVDAIPAAFSETYTRTQTEKLKLVWNGEGQEAITPEQQAKLDEEHADLVAGMFGFSKEARSKLKPGERIQFGKGSLNKDPYGKGPDKQLIRKEKGQQEAPQQPLPKSTKPQPIRKRQK